MFVHTFKRNPPSIYNNNNNNNNTKLGKFFSSNPQTKRNLQRNVKIGPDKIHFHPFRRRKERKRENEKKRKEKGTYPKFIRSIEGIRRIRCAFSGAAVIFNYPSTPFEAPPPPPPHSPPPPFEGGPLRAV